MKGAERCPFRSGRTVAPARYGAGGRAFPADPRFTPFAGAGSISMRTDQIIRLLLLFACPLLVGCHKLAPEGQAWSPPWGQTAPPPQPCPPPQAVWCDPACPPYPGPIYLAPGEVMVQPPPTVQQPLVGPVQTGPVAAPQPSWWNVLPEGSGAISPDFGLPAGPVVENPVPNPLIIPVANNELAWDQLADVVTNYFPIKSEQQVQQVGGMLTEGYIETPYQIGATVLEPQRNDSVGPFNRWQSTLQTIRRKAIINVQPTAGGYAVRVTVAKQLEDLPRPEQSPSGAAVLLTDGSLPTDRQASVDLLRYSPVWIDLGRDEPLEQEMLRRIQERLTTPQSPHASQPVF